MHSWQWYWSIVQSVFLHTPVITIVIIIIIIIMALCKNIDCRMISCLDISTYLQQGVIRAAKGLLRNFKSSNLKGRYRALFDSQEGRYRALFDSQVSISRVSRSRIPIDSSGKFGVVEVGNHCWGCVLQRYQIGRLPSLGFISHFAANFVEGTLPKKEEWRRGNNQKGSWIKKIHFGSPADFVLYQVLWEVDSSARASVQVHSRRDAASQLYNLHSLHSQGRTKDRDFVYSGLLLQQHMLTHQSLLAPNHLSNVVCICGIWVLRLREITLFP